MTALECDPVTLVLETLRGDQTLDLRSLGVYFLALALGLDFTTNDELANLQPETGWSVLYTIYNLQRSIRLNSLLLRRGLAKKL
jgi:hypothetical protein